MNPTDVTLAYTAPRGVAARYSLAVTLLTLSGLRSIRFAAAAVIVGGAWWAVVGIYRQQSSWWLGLLLAVCLLAGLVIVFATACFRRELKDPTYSEGHTVTSTVTTELLTFNLQRGPKRVRRSDIGSVRHALGFALVTLPEFGFYVVVPKQLMPADSSS